ncbi:Polypeptide N-acetylgalactosaminyltransferase 14 [Galemys pyrenaicus]|uniref:Polypeptide N-acetylgalactosaminyltransferase 14 n=1 Tax=Galemys pyrenaicus TaxID=202257 RepID=A0A8J5ZV14_GALPY|nr:Polypeptide N-acetylgalactosaminyltransferase 14 [Galemys pyrenaicus]
MLPIFGVLWITVMLFFWVSKKKLEVPTGPEVQTPKLAAGSPHVPTGTLSQRSAVLSGLLSCAGRWNQRQRARPTPGSPSRHNQLCLHLLG